MFYLRHCSDVCTKFISNAIFITILYRGLKIYYNTVIKIVFKIYRIWNIYAIIFVFEIYLYNPTYYPHPTHIPAFQAFNPGEAVAPFHPPSTWNPGSAPGNTVLYCIALWRYLTIYICSIVVEPHRSITADLIYTDVYIVCRAPFY